MDIRALFNVDAFEYSCYEHSLSLSFFFFFCSFAFVCIALNFLRNLGVEFWGYMSIYLFFTKELQIILHSASSSLFLLAMYENLHYSIFFSEFGVVNLNFIYFYWHVVVTHSLNLQFSDD